MDPLESLSKMRPCFLMSGVAPLFLKKYNINIILRCFAHVNINLMFVLLNKGGARFTMDRCATCLTQTHRADGVAIICTLVQPQKSVFCVIPAIRTKSVPLQG